MEQILTISGKPGLFKLLSKTRSGFVVESLLDGKRSNIGLHHNVSLLSEIAIYTLEEEKPLVEVFKIIKEKENGGQSSVPHNASKDQLEEYFFSILPNFDEEKVYPSHIKKIIQWYNLLNSNDLLNFTEEEKSEEKEA